MCSSRSVLKAQTYVRLRMSAPAGLEGPPDGLSHVCIFFPGVVLVGGLCRSARSLPHVALQKKSTAISSSSASAAVASAGEATCENRSFFGAGGDGTAWWSAPVGGVVGTGWVSWPVCVTSGGPSGGVAWLTEACDAKSWGKVGDLCVFPWYSLVSAFVKITRSSASRWLCVPQLRHLMPLPFCHRVWLE